MCGVSSAPFASCKRPWASRARPGRQEDRKMFFLPFADPGGKVLGKVLGRVLGRVFSEAGFIEDLALLGWPV